MKKYSVNSDRVVWRNIDGEAVILNLDNGFYYTLNEIGTLIWQMLNMHKDAAQITQRISQDYNISEQRAKKDLDSLISDLKKEKLLLVK
ncbi:MAG: PqqD family protein [Candidatus Omnitrophica bacterium]|nr:PqqD family protein [Candidatus Omnitrophota bacterium]